MSRLNLTDSFMDAVVKMSDGNPGAATAIAETTKVAESIDLQNAFGWMGFLFALDTHEIYGSSIYVLWNDKCQRDCRRMLVLLRAVHLGLMRATRLQRLAADQSREVVLGEEEYAKLDELVCERLVEFQRVTKELGGET